MRPLLTQKLCENMVMPLQLYEKQHKSSNKVQFIQTSFKYDQELSRKK